MGGGHGTLSESGVPVSLAQLAFELIGEVQRQLAQGLARGLSCLGAKVFDELPLSLLYSGDFPIDATPQFVGRDRSTLAFVDRLPKPIEHFAFQVFNHRNHSCVIAA
jgi:hypothetical protein